MSQQPRRDLRLFRVLAAYCLMAVVEIAMWVTVMLYAYEQGGTAAAGLATGLSLLPAALLAPALGTLGDRLPRGVALSGAFAATALVTAAVAALLIADRRLPLVVALAACFTICISIVRPTHYAVMPQLASTPQSLVWANSATSFASGIGAFVGPAIAGVAAATIGAGPLVAAMAVAMALSAALTVGLGLPASTEGEESAGALREAVEGLRHVGSDVSVLALLALSGIAYVAMGALEILGVTFAAEALGADESGQGLLVGAAGLGALAGALLGAGLAFRRRLSSPVAFGLAAAGLPLLLMPSVGTLILAITLAALFGVGERFSALASETLLQRATDDAVLARVFAVAESVMLLGYAAGTIVAPLLVGWFGARASYLPLGIALVVLSLGAWPLMRALDDRAIFRADVLALFKRVSFLSAMRPAALDRLSNNAQWVDVRPDTAVITQGDSGDAYYLVGAGELSVEIDGEVRAHRIAEGEGFGEIALLHDIPRTATVTSLNDCRLLRIERDDFLAAVTRSADGHQIALEVAAAHLGESERAS